jgi:hypothetical protein
MNKSATRFIFVRLEFSAEYHAPTGYATIEDFRMARRSTPALGEVLSWPGQGLTRHGVPIN